MGYATGKRKYNRHCRSRLFTVVAELSSHSLHSWKETLSQLLSTPGLHLHHDQLNDRMHEGCIVMTVEFSVMDAQYKL